eukprot:14908831-Ditylum_brightwellii.AAC.1
MAHTTNEPMSQNAYNRVLRNVQRIINDYGSEAALREHVNLVRNLTTPQSDYRARNALLQLQRAVKKLSI